MIRLYVNMADHVVKCKEGGGGRRQTDRRREKETEREKERECAGTTQCCPGASIQYKAGVTLLSTLMVQSGNKLRGCPGLYRNLLLTAESHTGLPYSYKAASSQPAANTAGHPVKDLAGSRSNTHSFV